MKAALHRRMRRVSRALLSRPPGETGIDAMPLPELRETYDVPPPDKLETIRRVAAMIPKDRAPDDVVALAVAVRGLPFIRLLSDAAVLSIASTILLYKAVGNRELYRQGAVGKTVYVLLDGVAEMRAKEEDSQTRWLGALTSTAVDTGSNRTSDGALLLHKEETGLAALLSSATKELLKGGEKGAAGSRETMSRETTGAPSGGEDAARGDSHAFVVPQGIIVEDTEEDQLFMEAGGVPAEMGGRAPGVTAALRRTNSNYAPGRPPASKDEGPRVIVPKAKEPPDHVYGPLQQQLMPGWSSHDLAVVRQERRKETVLLSNACEVLIVSMDDYEKACARAGNLVMHPHKCVIALMRTRPGEAARVDLPPLQEFFPRVPTEELAEASAAGAAKSAAMGALGRLGGGGGGFGGMGKKMAAAGGNTREDEALLGMTLKRLRFFQMLDAELVREMASNLHLFTVAAGHTVFREGDTDAGEMFIILAGEVQMYSKASADRQIGSSSSATLLAGESGSDDAGNSKDDGLGAAGEQEGGGKEEGAAAATGAGAGGGGAESRGAAEDAEAGGAGGSAEAVAGAGTGAAAGGEAEEKPRDPPSSPPRTPRKHQQQEQHVRIAPPGEPAAPEIKNRQPRAPARKDPSFMRAATMQAAPTPARRGRGSQEKLDAPAPTPRRRSSSALGHVGPDPPTPRGPRGAATATAGAPSGLDAAAALLGKKSALNKLLGMGKDKQTPIQRALAVSMQGKEGSARRPVLAQRPPSPPTSSSDDDDLHHKPGIGGGRSGRVLRTHTGGGLKGHHHHHRPRASRDSVGGAEEPAAPEEVEAKPDDKSARPGPHPKYGECVAVLGCGETFGEKSIITSGPRQCTVLASEGVVGFTLARKDVARMAGVDNGVENIEIDRGDAERILAALQVAPEARGDDSALAAVSSLIDRSERLKQLPERVRADVARFCRLRDVAKDDVVYSEGDAADSFYIILEGMCTQHVQQGSGKGGGKRGEQLGFLDVVRRAMRSALDPSVMYGPCSAILIAGHGFGERALLGTHMEAHRPATVIARQDSRLLSIPAHLFEASMQREMQRVMDLKVSLLRGLWGLAGVPDAKLYRLASSMRQARAPRGVPVVKQGAPGQVIFIVRDGELRVTQRRSRDAEGSGAAGGGGGGVHVGSSPRAVGKKIGKGQEIIPRRYRDLLNKPSPGQVVGSTSAEVEIAEIGPGEYFGDYAVLSRRPEPATVTATRETTLYVVAEEDLTLRLPDDVLQQLRLGCVERHERQGQRASAIRSTRQALVAYGRAEIPAPYMPRLHTSMLRDRTGGYLTPLMPPGGSVSARAPPELPMYRVMAPPSGGPHSAAEQAQQQRVDEVLAAHRARDLNPQAYRVSGPGQLQDAGLVPANYVLHSAEAAVATRNHMLRQPHEVDMSLMQALEDDDGGVSRTVSPGPQMRGGAREGGEGREGAGAGGEEPPAPVGPGVGGVARGRTYRVSKAPPVVAATVAAASLAKDLEPMGGHYGVYPSRARQNLRDLPLTHFAGVRPVSRPSSTPRNFVPVPNNFSAGGSQTARLPSEQQQQGPGASTGRMMMMAGVSAGTPLTSRSMVAASRGRPAGRHSPPRFPPGAAGRASPPSQHRWGGLEREISVARYGESPPLEKQQEQQQQLLQQTQTPAQSRRAFTGAPPSGGGDRVRSVGGNRLQGPGGRWPLGGSTGSLILEDAAAAEEEASAAAISAWPSSGGGGGGGGGGPGALPPPLSRPLVPPGRLKDVSSFFDVEVLDPWHGSSPGWGAAAAGVDRDALLISGGKMLKSRGRERPAPFTSPFPTPPRTADRPRQEPSEENVAGWGGQPPPHEDLAMMPQQQELAAV